MSLRWMFFGVVACLLAECGAVGAEPTPPKIEYRAFAPSEGAFRCEVPRQWGEIRDDRAEARVHYHGIYLFGPNDGEPLGPKISVRYFSPDNTLKDTAEKYLRRQLKPSIVALRGEKTSPPADVKLAGRSATTFTRDTFEFFPPESLDTKQIPFREEYYVAPHLGGFVVVIYAAPTTVFARWRPVLQRVLDTFRFLPEQAVIVVHAAARGLAAEEIETKVSAPVETQLAGLPGLTDVRSASTSGASAVRLTFKQETDLGAVRLEIQRRMEALREQLPTGTVTLLEPTVADDERPLLIALYSQSEAKPDEAVLRDLEILAERSLRPRLTAVPGVARAEILGGGLRYEIALSIERTAQHSVDVQQVFDAVKRRAAAVTGDERTSLDDLRRAAVVLRGGDSVSLGDVAEVRLARVDGGRRRLWFSGDAAGGGRLPAGVLLAVRRLADADSGAVQRSVAQAVDEVRTTLPEHVKVDVRAFGPSDASVRVLGSSGDAERFTADLDEAVADVARRGGVASIWRVDDAANGDGAELWCAVEPTAAGRRDEIVGEVRATFKRRLPEARVAVGRPSPLLSRCPAPLGAFTVTVSGPDQAVLQRVADDVAESLSAIAGVVDLEIVPSPSTPRMRFTANREAAARYGIDPRQAADVATSIAERRAIAMIAGPHGRPIGATVMLERNDPDRLAQVPLYAPAGARVPLASLVDIALTAEPDALWRQNGRRVVVVGCNVDRRDPNDALRAIAEACRTVRLPLGYATEVKRN